MAAVAQNAEIVEQQGRGGDLKPERLFAALHGAGNPIQTLSTPCNGVSASSRLAHHCTTICGIIIDSGGLAR